MDAEERRCTDARTIRLLNEAFRRGDLEALRAACRDPALVPNGPMPPAIGTCLVYAIYHSPLAFIRTLLEHGADPDLRTHTPSLGTHAAAGYRWRRRTGAAAAELSDSPATVAESRRTRALADRVGPVGTARLDDNGETLITEVRGDRRSLANGLFYGLDGMRIGGTRRLEIAPHLGYGDRGVPGIIPERAVLTAEITVLDSRPSTSSPPHTHPE